MPVKLFRSMVTSGLRPTHSRSSWERLRGLASIWTPGPEAWLPPQGLLIGVPLQSPAGLSPSPNHLQVFIPSPDLSPISRLSHSPAHVGLPQVSAGTFMTRAELSPSPKLLLFPASLPKRGRCNIHAEDDLSEMLRIIQQEGRAELGGPPSVGLHCPSLGSSSERECENPHLFPRADLKVVNPDDLCRGPHV